MRRLCAGFCVKISRRHVPIAGPTLERFHPDYSLAKKGGPQKQVCAMTVAFGSIKKVLHL